MDAKGVIDKLNEITDLGRKEKYKALNWLIKNEDDFFVVKNLRSEEKKGYILALCQANNKEISYVGVSSYRFWMYRKPGCLDGLLSQDQFLKGS